MPVKSLRDMFVEEASDLYDAEKKILRALPKMAKTATSPELRQAFEMHMAQTEEHVARLEQVFESLDTKPKRKPCKGVAALIEESKELMEKQGNEPSAMEAGMIAGAQKV